MTAKNITLTYSKTQYHVKKEFTKTSTFEEIKRHFEGTENIEAMMLIRYVDVVLTKGKPNEHAKYCKERLIEIANSLP